jgi:hypothetical protein
MQLPIISYYFITDRRGVAGESCPRRTGSDLLGADDLAMVSAFGSVTEEALAAGIGRSSDHGLRSEVLPPVGTPPEKKRPPGVQNKPPSLGRRGVREGSPLPASDGLPIAAGGASRAPFGLDHIARVERQRSAIGLKDARGQGIIVVAGRARMSAWVAYVRRTATTTWYQVGTCKLGSTNSPSATQICAFSV